MKMRSLLMGLLVAASAQGAAAARADTVMLADITVKSLNDIAEIKVDGSLQKGPYDSVRNKTLDYVIAARGERHKKFVGDPLFWLKVDSGGSGGGGSNLGEDWKKFAVTRDYIDPRAIGIEGRRVSPIDLCNAKLKAADGSARAGFLKKGVAFLHEDAYEVTGRVWVEYGAALKTAEESETIRVPVKITCMPLDRPRPREKAETKGPPPREGREMKLTIAEVSLRIEPMQITQMGKFLCPAQLRLYGKLKTIRAFAGKSMFWGPHYFSKVEDILKAEAAVSTVTATYPMTWHKMGDKAIAPNAAPAKQKLTFRFNVSDKDGKLLESAERTIEVGCKKIKANAPTAGDGVTVNPVN